ncbi:MAG: class I SAM-dependent methyltransferase [Dehalogenimonas sp.]|nr:class I SAM-dependent methyltransferase [Dehalogenimonas sp.]
MVASEGMVSPFDPFAEAYDDWFDGEGKLIFASELAALQLVLPDLPGSWLEIGVGSGRFAQALGIDKGIDPSTRLLALAKRRGVQVFQAGGEDHLFDVASYGAVFLILTLCFVQSPIKVLREAQRILIPGGKVVIAMIPNNSRWGRQYQDKKAAGHAIYKRATFFGLLGVLEMMLEAGFSFDRMVSTLFQDPEQVTEEEVPRTGYHAGAGFYVIVGQKPASF